MNDVLNQNSLDRLAISYNTDKSSRFHNYTKVYNMIFDQLKDENFLNDLKILCNHEKLINSSLKHNYYNRWNILASEKYNFEWDSNLGKCGHVCCLYNNAQF